MSVELVHVFRGTETESIHRGDIVGVDRSGTVVFEYGDKNKRTFWRSSAKPFQIVPFIRQGGLEKYHINDKELSLMTASHGGEQRHIEVLTGILNKLGKTIDDLDCGVSRPMYEGEYKRLLKENIDFNQGNNPCSGKHCGMLGLGILMGIDLTNYIEKNHEIQKIMHTVISEFCQIEKSEIDIAIDGCGVPVFGMPIYNMALAYSKLDEKTEIMERISKAMTKEPFFVAGTTRLDTIIMEETKGKILAKLGAESVYSMTVMGRGIGIAMKIEDGAYRALDAVVPELLKRHDYITLEEYKAINNRLSLDVKNHRQQVVGGYKVVF